MVSALSLPTRLNIHGNVDIFLNATYGDQFMVANNILGDDNSSLTVNKSSYNPQTNSWVTATSTLGSNQFSSRSNQFTTDGGLILDGQALTDSGGFSRGVGRLVPPSILQEDPQTKQTRYLEITSDSGVQVNGYNSGQSGHGSGVYVDNTTDLQVPKDEAGRAGTESTESLRFDMMNPNNGDKTTGWRGNFYVPVGAYVQFLSDGFTIQRDDQGWRNPDGSQSSVGTRSDTGSASWTR